MTHLLIDKRYVSLDKLRLEPGRERFEIGDYLLTSLENVAAETEGVATAAAVRR